MKSFLNIGLAAAIALMAGCATPPMETAQNPGETATCEVCRYNNDLACLCVKVKEKTPHAEYQGKAYYFCSEDCRIAFQKRPAKYVAQPKSRQPGS